MEKSRLEFIVSIMVGIIAGGFIFIAALKYVLPAISPFAIAWIIAMAVRSPAAGLSKRARIPERILRLMMALLAMIISFGLLTLGIWRGTAALWRFLSDIGEGGAVYDFLTALLSPGSHIFGDGIPEELALRIESAFGQMLSSALSRLAEALTSWVAFVPKALFFLLISAISVVYFALDLEKINAWARRLLPRRLTDRLSRVRREVFSMCGKYARAYLLLMLITFVIMLVGFLLLGVRNATLIAVIVALLDVLPVIGVGTVLVPWSVFCLITGQSSLGIGLIVLFLVNTVVRQVAEPKIIGKNLDMHPILTLVMLYVGYTLFGLMGLLLVPVAAVAVGALINKDHPPEVGKGPVGE